MTVANTQLIPEFQYYFSNFVKNSIVNRYGIPMPVEVDASFIPSGTVVELLCNETFPYDEYTYLYKNEDRVQCWPTLTRQRLMIYPGSQYMVPATAAEGGINIFNLNNYDFMMLDTLLAYRHDSTSVTIIDSTSIQFIQDATAGTTILYASLDLLAYDSTSQVGSALAQEIYLYLQFKINSNYELYNTNIITSDCSLLATCFEFKLIDEYFQFMTNREVTFGIECD